MGQSIGVHSEVGKLRTVMVCRPGLAHQRLTPANCHDLLFDDVIWVHEAQKDHYDFVLKMEERGVEVLDLHDLLAETLEDAQARRSSRCSTAGCTANSVGPNVAKAIRPWLDDLSGPQLANALIGGIAIEELPKSESSNLLLEMHEPGHHFLKCRRSIPNSLFQRDPSCWIYDGVTCNPMFWPARQPGDPACGAPSTPGHTRGSRDADFPVHWFGELRRGVHRSQHEGRRRHAHWPRRRYSSEWASWTTHQAVGQVAEALFEQRRPTTQVIACVLRQSQAAMHLDTVFTACATATPARCSATRGRPDRLLQPAARTAMPAGPRPPPAWTSAPRT